MPEFILNHRVMCQDLSKELGTEGESNFRIYKSSPTGGLIQLRAFGSTNDKSTGVKRHMLATMDYVNRGDLIKIRDAIQGVIDELPE